ncbi:hypothetical protein FRC20_008947, partial [Serendipita sp. 405]
MISLPPEIWLQIFSFLALPRPALDVPISLFDIDTNSHIQEFDASYAASMQLKLSLQLVCKSWSRLSLPLFWEVICVRPGRRSHAIGSALQKDYDTSDENTKLTTNWLGSLVRTLHIRDFGQYSVFDLANIERILRLCPRLETITNPDSWQLFRSDFHLDISLSSSIREVHLALLGEQSIKTILNNGEDLQVVHGSNYDSELCPSMEEVVLPLVHTLSMRLSDMEYRNIRAPQLQRWIIHDSIIGIESTQSFHHHANCVTTLELPCSWPDYRTIDAVLSDMPNLQDLIIHLDPENLSPIAHRLPPHLRRLGISASYSYYGDVLNSDEITYNWWRDHLEDWIALALQSAATLQLV